MATAEILGPSVGASGSTVLKVHPILPSWVKISEIGQGQLWLLCGFGLRSERVQIRNEAVYRTTSVLCKREARMLQTAHRDFYLLFEKVDELQI